MHGTEACFVNRIPGNRPTCKSDSNQSAKSSKRARSACEDEFYCVDGLDLLVPLAFKMVHPINRVFSSLGYSLLYRMAIQLTCSQVRRGLWTHLVSWFDNLSSLNLIGPSDCQPVLSIRASAELTQLWTENQKLTYLIPSNGRILINLSQLVIPTFKDLSSQISKGDHGAQISRAPDTSKKAVTWLGNTPLKVTFIAVYSSAIKNVSQKELQNLLNRILRCNILSVALD